ncbi:FUSC family protein [Rhodococcoides yunnanense]|uniref:FUSC family protein n=1 Tax=Rhodococcoides yunnanense TaxID=278209 RepID=UPI000934A285|nr:FUSC family protein [Rhodococcus yunnanensis]
MPSAPTRSLRWEWNAAALGVVYALPASIVTYFDVTRGAAFAVGVIPAAIVGLAPTRRGRLRVLLLGLMTGIPLVLGSVVAAVPWLAVATMFVLSFGAVVLARASPAGSVVLVLSLPMAAVGLSYSDLSTSLGLALVLLGGSVYAAVVSLIWPAGQAKPAPAGEPPALDYGVRLGAAAAAAAGIGFMFGLEHVGWASAAVLLVMRPGAEQTTLRMAGRVVSVFVGGAAAVLLVQSGAEAWIFGIAVLACVACAAATHASRWYVTSTFTTFLVLLLLIAPSPEDATFRFNERLTETVLGVGLAWLFGIALPAVLGYVPDSVEPVQQPGPTRPSRPE